MLVKLTTVSNTWAAESIRFHEVIDTATAQRHGSARLSICAVVQLGKNGDIVPLVIRSGVPNPSRGLPNIIADHTMVPAGGAGVLPNWTLAIPVTALMGGVRKRASWHDAACW